MKNEDIMQKAISVAETLATSGKLNPQQANKFIDYVVDESMMKNNVRIARFKPDQLEIDKLNIAGRVVFPATEYQAPEYRSTVATSQVLLNPRELIAAFDITDNFKEENLEGESVEDSLVRMFAKGWANDTEGLSFNGDSTGPSAAEGDVYSGGSATGHILDPLLSLFDGWLRLSDGAHIVDALGSPIGLSIFSEAIRAMPTKFRKNKRDLRFFMSSDLYQIYIEKVATRQTAKGDMASEGESQSPFGISIVEVPLIDFLPPVVEEVTLNGTTAVSLRYAPMSAEFVTPETLSSTVVTPYVEGTDYDMDYTAGTIARNGGGTIGDGDTVKITYSANPQMLLTHWKNFIYGISRDIRVERARNIHKRANEYVVTAKMAVQIEELDAIVKVQNISSGV